MTTHAAMENDLTDQIVGAGKNPDHYNLCVIAEELLTEFPRSISDLWVVIDSHQLDEWAVYDGFANHWGTVHADSEMGALAQFNDCDAATWRAIPAADEFGAAEPKGKDEQ